MVVVEAFQGQGSRLQLEGVQFRHVGQAFRRHRSALTVTGNTWMAGEFPALRAGGPAEEQERLLLGVE